MPGRLAGNERLVKMKIDIDVLDWGMGVHGGNGGWRDGWCTGYYGTREGLQYSREVRADALIETAHRRGWDC